MNDMNKQEKLALFLSLQSFDEYMDHFEDLIGLPSGNDVFIKEMHLMEGDKKYTRRQKDSILQRRKRQRIQTLKKEIAKLRDEAVREGRWSRILPNEMGIPVVYQFPDGKNGDVAQAIAYQIGIPEEIDEEHFIIRVSAADKEMLETMCFLSRSYFGGYDYSDMETDPASVFMDKYHRLFQIENRMWEVNQYKPEEYRSLRTVKDPILRGLLTDYHQIIRAERDRIYEELVSDNATHARWISEQKAYAIVKEVHPDAIFQYEPEWLRGQSLDIFIPSQNAAIEYQGAQHFKPIGFFGGDRGLSDNRRRDQRKKLLCEQNGVKLIYWDYTEPLTPEHYIWNIDRRIRSGSEEEREEEKNEFNLYESQHPKVSG